MLIPLNGSGRKKSMRRRLQLSLALSCSADAAGWRATSRARAQDGVRRRDTRGRRSSVNSICLSNTIIPFSLRRCCSHASRRRTRRNCIRPPRPCSPWWREWRRGSCPGSVEPALLMDAHQHADRVIGPGAERVGRRVRDGAVQLGEFLRLRACVDREIGDAVGAPERGAGEFHRPRR